ncbi:hypothetical protein ADM98_00665 [Exiguobacterium sp. BMC-KP]|uniref:AAA family ATPase n=1 Tax=Exiguobacterium sp. BMC-KP TaxID=1684312 RepID=UPI0006AA1828|nr:AAA family ATPase [Exiguobacterium sp. BMC-KP]KOP31397.1 hypothetical protein ADM98_00665 [Exiguobacterium sp. BMC-KP]
MKLIYLLELDKEKETFEEIILQNLLTIDRHTKDDKTTILNIKKLDIQIPIIDDYIFRETPNIKAVNVIVGRNGSGKTKILNRIKMFLDYNSHETLTNRYLGIFYDEYEREHGIIDKKLFFYTTSTEMKIEILTHEKELFIEPLSKVDLKKIINTNCVVHYTDELNKSDFIINSTHNSDLVRDMTFGKTIRKSSKNAFDDRKSESSIANGTYMNPIAKYFKEEMEWQLNFLEHALNEAYYDFLNFPTKIYVSMDYQAPMAELAKRLKSINPYPELFDEERLLSKISESIENSPHDDFEKALLKCILFDGLNEFYIKNLTVEPVKEHKELHVRFLSSLSSLSFKRFNSAFDIAEALDRIHNEVLKKDTSVFDFFNYVEYYLSTMKVSYKKNILKSDLFEISLKNSDEVKGFSGFREKYNDMSFMSYLEFDWGMSTGENKLLNLYSTLYSIRNDLYEFNGHRSQETLRIRKTTLWLLIDEAGSSLHPEGQSTYIDSMVRSVSRFFPEHDVQIILTTHSPIILSDVPHHNIYYISKEERNETSMTFSQNIYSLFKDSFLLDNVTGRLAIRVSERMKRDIAFIEDSMEIVTKNALIDSIRLTTNIIGEDITRIYYQEKINSLLNEVVSDRVKKTTEIYDAMNEHEKNRLIQYILNKEKRDDY